MKRILFFYCALVFSSQSFAQLRALPEVYNFFNKGGGGTLVSDIFLYAPIREKPSRFSIGVYVYGERTIDDVPFYQSMVGPTYVFVEKKNLHLELGFLAGIESGKEMWRMSPWMLVSAFKDRVSMLAVYETGASGPGYRVQAYSTLNKLEAENKLMAGWVLYGPLTGPSVQFKRKKFALFIAPYVFSIEQKNVASLVTGISGDL